MNVDASMVTAAVAIFGAGGTWAILSYRVRQLEAERKAATTAAEELGKKVDELNRTLEFVRQSQGTRLGGVEDKLSDMRGRLAVFADWLKTAGDRRRSKTAAGGHQIEGVSE